MFTMPVIPASSWPGDRADVGDPLLGHGELELDALPCRRHDRLAVTEVMSCSIVPSLMSTPVYVPGSATISGGAKANSEATNSMVSPGWYVTSAAAAPPPPAPPAEPGASGASSAHAAPSGCEQRGGGEHPQQTMLRGRSGTRKCHTREVRRPLHGGQSRTSLDEGRRQGRSAVSSPAPRSPASVSSTTATRHPPTAAVVPTRCLADLPSSIGHPPAREKQNNVLFPMVHVAGHPGPASRATRSSRSR